MTWELSNLGNHANNIMAEKICFSHIMSYWNVLLFFYFTGYYPAKFKYPKLKRKP